MPLQSIGERGEMLDVNAVKEEWVRQGLYGVTPKGAQTLLRLLVIGGQATQRPWMTPNNALLRWPSYWRLSGPRVHRVLTLSHTGRPLSRCLKDIGR
jgi:hypothetical protein